MPVFMVKVNEFSARGLRLAHPELIGVMAPVRDARHAVAKTLEGECLAVRDVEVEKLSDSNECWFDLGNGLLH